MEDEQEDYCKREIRRLFTGVKKKHREQVLTALRGIRANEDRLRYLKGWVSFDEVSERR